MIIVRLYGGLGNQFFQYATARSLALQRKTSVALDLSWFDSNTSNQTNREPQINHFRIQAHNWNSNKKRFEHFLKQNKYAKRIFLYSNRIPYLKEEQFNPKSSNNKLSNDLYLDGYWQNYQYFKNIKSILQHELIPNHQLDEKNQVLERIIKQNQSVCLHVRRGDYVSNPLSIHRILDLNYYQGAINYIRKRISNPFFYIFSDDPEWCKENFLLDNTKTTFVEHNIGTQSYKDLELMKFCKHFIIANSTFSWWSAWLGANKSSIVIAPSQWFKNEFKNQILMPDEWVIM